jgi:F-type H+-transporting ATPase subunit b
MLFLAANSLIAPTVGMVFWALVIFVLTWLFLGKFTFKPIAKALREREESIDGALAEAEKARTEMARIQKENAAALKNQQAERTAMMREAKEAKEQIIKEAREEAKVVTARMIADARVEIEAQTAAAMMDVRNSAGQLAVDVAQKVLRNQLNDPSAQTAYAESLIKEIKLN